MMYPLSGEVVAVGVVGGLFYSLVLCFACIILLNGVYYCMACVELPRFWEMLLTGEYKYRSVYCLHILGGSFFFTAFSIVCYQWAKLLHIGAMTRIVFGRSGLLIANIVFICVDAIAVGICAASTSLRLFFSSKAFIVLTSVEAAKNTVYAAALSYYGLKLVWKLWGYSQNELRHTTIRAAIYHSLFDSERHASIVEASFDSNDEEMKDCEYHGSRSSLASSLSSTQPPEVTFLGVVIRITYVLILSTVCFALRVTMMALTLTAIHTPLTVTSPSFSMYGMAWMFFADFIPRVIPALSLMIMMRQKHHPIPAADILVHVEPAPITATNISASTSIGAGVGAARAVGDPFTMSRTVSDGGHRLRSDSGFSVVSWE